MVMYFLNRLAHYKHSDLELSDCFLLKLINCRYLAPLITFHCGLEGCKPFQAMKNAGDPWCQLRIISPSWGWVLNMNMCYGTTEDMIYAVSETCVCEMILEIISSDYGR